MSRPEGKRSKGERPAASASSASPETRVEEADGRAGVEGEEGGAEITRGRFAELFKEHSRGLYRYAARYTGSGYDAREIVHGVFERLWRDRRSFELQGGSLTSYLYRATRNSALDWMEHREVVTRYAEERQRPFKGRSKGRHPHAPRRRLGTRRSWPIGA